MAIAFRIASSSIRGCFSLRCVASGTAPQVSSWHSKVEMESVRENSGLDLTTRHQISKPKTRVRARSLIQDMKRRVVSGDGRHINATIHCSSTDFFRFAAMAEEGLASFSIEDILTVFYWLAKCAKSADQEIDQGLALRYAAYIREKVSRVPESELALVFRAFSKMLNQNKLTRGLVPYKQLDDVVHSMLSETLPRLRLRHRHLRIAQVVGILSVYAKMYRPEYQSLFDDVGEHLLSLAANMQGSSSELDRYVFFNWAPYVLVSYARAQVANERVLSRFLDACADNVQELTFGHVAVIAYAMKLVDFKHLQMWRVILADMQQSSPEYAMRDLGQIASACVSQPVDVSGDPKMKEIRAIHIEVVHLIGAQVVRRAAQCGNEDVYDIASAYGSLPVSELVENDIQAICALCAEASTKVKGFSAAYAALTFDALTSLYHVASAHNEVWSLLLRALAAVSGKLRDGSYGLCTATQILSMAEALFTLVSGNQVLRITDLKDLRLGTILLMQQRERVRKADEFEGTAFVDFAYATAYAALLVQQEDEEVLRPWFLHHALEFVESERFVVSDAKGSVNYHSKLAWMRDSLENRRSAE